jgi:hypothetical protein
MEGIVLQLAPREEVRKFGKESTQRGEILNNAWHCLRMKSGALMVSS